MTVTQVFQSGRAAFDANGIARVSLGPDRQLESWRITLTTITTTSVLATVLKLYRQHETPSALVDVSRFNGNDDVSDSIIELIPTEKLLGVWTGGTPGAIATLTVSGMARR